MPPVAKTLTDAQYRKLAEFRHRLRLFLAFSEQQAQHAGLTSAQHQLLLAVRGFGATPPTIGELAARMVLKHHSTVELIARLEERGLVQRQRLASDRRFARVKLTARGSRVLHALSLAHRAELARLGPELARSLVSLLGPSASSRRVPAGLEEARGRAV